jgi:acetyl/propionyl-CoA carboxylase alpha subunit
MEVTPHYDPLLAKIVVHGQSRTQAIGRLDEALGETALELEGPAGAARTNVEFCRQLIAAEPFVDGRYDTLFAEAFAKEQRKA